jgi:FKBP-type peptidyl-prolyl cis-trans isomerase SlyD
VCFEPRELFPEGTEPGMRFEGLPPGAATTGMPDDALYTVTEVYPEHVVLDGNHPLAGIALRLHVKVLDVREASDDEAQAGSVGEQLLSVAGSPGSDDTLH